MGRLLGYLADALALVRLALEFRAAYREFRHDGAAAEPLGTPAVGRSAEEAPADRAGEVGPSGPPLGPAAREGAGPVSGPVTGG